MGVYVVYAGDLIIYVGRSVNIAGRWSCHERYPDFVDSGMTHAGIIKLDRGSEVARVEATLIRALRPPLNRSIPKSDRGNPIVPVKTKPKRKKRRKSKASTLKGAEKVKKRSRTARIPEICDFYLQFFSSPRRNYEPKH